MKYTIKYEINQDIECPCCAVTTIDGQRFYAVGATWKRAKERLLQKIIAVMEVGEEPEPEEIEI